ncbi:MAG: hypothetical protein ACLVCQ_07075, partial [Subdoligranulum sp.]
MYLKSKISPLHFVHQHIAAGRFFLAIFVFKSEESWLTSAYQLLRQHRTIPALRLKHRSGSCGTASA